MREPLERLRDMLEAIARIERYGHRGHDGFEQDELLQSHCLRLLQIIGEAARALPPEVRDLAPEIPWKNVIGMRTILVHGYFEIDTEVVWDAIVNDLPQLKPQLEKLLTRLEQDQCR
jgi:uncharacterized protein with HEPN domain